MFGRPLVEAGSALMGGDHLYSPTFLSGGIINSKSPGGIIVDGFEATIIDKNPAAGHPFPSLFDTIHPRILRSDDSSQLVLASETPCEPIIMVGPFRCTGSSVLFQTPPPGGTGQFFPHFGATAFLGTGMTGAGGVFPDVPLIGSHVTIRIEFPVPFGSSIIFMCERPYALMQWGCRVREFYEATESGASVPRPVRIPGGWNS